MQEKYGFIYIWYDRKHQRYYLGRHWGTENDGYICSQSNMRNNFKNRPEDFKRRIVSIVNDKQALVEEEQRWLNMINIEELGKKYYNINNRATTPTMRGRKHSAETVQKIRSKNIGKTRTEETKQKLREANAIQFANPEQRESRKQKGLKNWSDCKYREHMIKVHSGKKQTAEQVAKRVNSNKKRWKTTPKKGVPKSDIEKQRISLMSKGKIWINNGIKSIRINKTDTIPEGFSLGRSFII